MDRHPLLIFLGSLIALSSAFVAVSQFVGVSMIALAPAYMFTPMLAGILTCIVATPSFERAGLRFPWNEYRWLAVAAVAPIVLILIGTGLSILLPGVEFVPDANPLTGEGTEFAPEGGDADAPVGPSLPEWPLNLLITVVAALVFGATINAVFAFGEEFGWRGVLLTELAPLGFWGASAIIGVLWGLWHAPVILEGYNYPNNPVLGVAVMTAATLTMSPVYTYVTVRARSVLAPTVFHGTFNAFAATMFVFAQGGSELIVNPVGAVGILVFAAVAVVIAVTGAPDLERDWALEDDATGGPRADSDAESVDVDVESGEHDV
ncbi:CPBP family intramembrane glutamic endopeptidase [Natrarchaeobius chitinivorans]|uniref:CPBP family intramembrane metalloprotease n=1 Tax=Natrarchaeobius chitinivorans TaxID=1679083 RepID=A0A3N6LZK2_NATCH|nr:CPBP family intramembrane glutamic endopeptidase [Natrarchaeobius chitinivorans]RQG94637.1 CPBP family intramembrane metalloprotease [Natrarchaeobius chitinivorans]